MARNGRRKKAGLKLRSIGNKIFPFVKAVSAPIAFFEQITAKDRQINAVIFGNATTTNQLKMLSNFVTGRLAGFGFFKGAALAPTPKQTLNPSGVLNKWTNAGLIGIAYKVVGSAVNKMSRDFGAGNIVPETSKIGSIAKSVLIGGALGGFFDDPVTNNVSNQTVQTSQIPQVILNNGSSADSTESSF